MAFSFDLGLAISAERYGAISAGPEHRKFDTLSTQPTDVSNGRSRYGWITYMEDPGLSSRLQALSPGDLELLTLLVIDGYRQADIARIKGCSRNVIYKKLKKIKKILKKG